MWFIAKSKLCCCSSCCCQRMVCFWSLTCQQVECTALQSRPCVLQQHMMVALAGKTQAWTLCCLLLCPMDRYGVPQSLKASNLLLHPWLTPCCHMRFRADCWFLFTVLMIELRDAGAALQLWHCPVRLGLSQSSAVLCCFRSQVQQCCTAALVCSCTNKEWMVLSSIQRWCVSQKGPAAGRWTADLYCMVTGEAS